MELKNSINIAIFGPVSVGKSTLLNGLFSNQLSDMKINRTTMLPQVYYGNDDNNNLDKSIYKINRENNKQLLNQKLTYENCVEIKHNIHNIRDIVNLPKNININIYDLPGLNDGESKDIYFNYIKKNFYKFDVILLVIDINEAFSTDGTREILNIISELITYQRIIIIANKCDDMFINNDTYELDEELNEMYFQIVRIVDEIKNKYTKFDSHIIPFCSQDIFIHRILKANPEFQLDMKYINKIGVNEFGKSKWGRLNEKTKRGKINTYINETDLNEVLIHSGFNLLKKKLSDLPYLEFFKNKINYYLGQISHIDDSNFNDIIHEYNKLFKLSSNMISKSGKNICAIDNHLYKKLNIWFLLTR
tara:strand:- start:960 stop:2045 length:1086 start_codon:yes stop_codon:yes gene_type:complete